MKNRFVEILMENFDLEDILEILDLAWDQATSLLFSDDFSSEGSKTRQYYKDLIPRIIKSLKDYEIIKQGDKIE